MTNEAKLQSLENDLVSLSRGILTIGQYFNKVKNVCAEISKLESKNPILEVRTRRILICDLRPEFKVIVTTTRWWSKEPTLAKLDNLLANVEILDDKMPKASIKEEEKVLLNKSKYSNGGEKALASTSGQKGLKKNHKWNKKWGNYQGEAKKNYNHRNKCGDEKNMKDNDRENGNCYIGHKKGHLARDCSHKKEEGNVATSSKVNDDEWDLEAYLTTKSPKGTT
ncbi:unnamed protein product [Linum tenue]|uniref:Uncharacterized protein n=1 Tax=Linum tenue TaxID=586396 RepID=A0AAV0MUZ1_9ROSI|nr:unnamed protein product [Linum tenue]